MKIIKENATFQQLLALKANRTKRAELKKFFVEGVQNIKEAIGNGWQIDCLIFAENNLSDWARGVIEQLNVINYSLDADLMKKLSGKGDTSELLAIVKMISPKRVTRESLILLLDRPSKKGNFGTIIRSADALGVDRIYFMGHAVDIYDPEVITASMGSFFKVPFTFLGSNEEAEELFKAWRKSGGHVVGTSLQADKRIDEVNFTKPTMLLVGNEAKGLSKFLVGNADTLAKIEMRGDIDSLNVACATSIFLYEISRQRKL